MTTTKTITVTSLGLSGPEWIKRLEEKNYRIGDYAKSMLLSPDYEKHRLPAGQTYTIAFVGSSEAKGKTTQEIKEIARSRGYEMPTAELACLIRETVYDNEITDMGAWFITVLHDPIKDSDGDPNVLSSNRRGGGLWLDAYWDRPVSQWYDGGAFAFPVPASQSSALSPSVQHSDPLSLTLEQRVSALEERVLKLRIN